GQADAFINDIASTSHMARQYNIVGFEPTALLEDRIQRLHMATRKDNPALHSIIDKALKHIDADTHRSIREKWIIMTPQKEKSPRLVLTPDEEAWLEQHPILHTTSDPSWMPYEGTDKSGNFIGMFSDMTTLIAKRLGITVDYIAAKDWDDVIHMAQHKKVDFITAIPTEARKEYLTFTSPIIVKELALLTRKEHPIIASFSTLEKKKVALIAGYGYNDEVLRKFPDHDYIYVNSIQEGLNGLSSNQYDIFIANITSSLYYISKEMLTDLQVAGTLDISFEIAYGVREDWKVFHGILEKALFSITDKERQEILNRWVKVDVIQKMDYTLLYQFGGIFLFIVLIILYWNRRLHREIERRQLAEAQLQKSHDEIQTLLDTAQNIIIVSNGKTLLNANQAFLDFFGYKVLDDFFEGHQCICDFFIQHDEYFHLGKIEDPALWVSTIKELPQTEQIVTMQGDHSPFPSAFSVRVSDLNDSDEFVISFTDITGIKMESKRHEFQATHDALTGLYNRLYIDRYLTHELQKCRELTIAVSVIILDIDFFKQVNDTYGHSAGDEVLKDLSSLLNASLRSNDKASRWGGEEFLIVLSGTTLQQAEQLAEKLRKKVVTHDFKEPQKISCSFGVASAKENDTIESLVNRADDALYQAKETGRNRVVVNA
ncbi:MAG: diguanylate cyclase, partial [Sulfurimonadaceae bacterium]|nr:diguanylate cyclase [Sulfurimonadaceae bacterium]